MNFFALTVISSALAALAFYFLGGSGVVTNNASMLLSFEAIIAAAVLVRLNRGIPSLEWKYVDTDALEDLLNRLGDVARTYVAVVAIAAVSILVLLATVFVDKLAFVAKSEVTLWLSTAFGALLGTLLSRMAYVVWLDLDIVRLQRAVILSAARAESAKSESQLAEEKIAAIGATRLSR